MIYAVKNADEKTQTIATITTTITTTSIDYKYVITIKISFTYFTSLAWLTTRIYTFK